MNPLPTHIQWLVDNYGESIKSRLLADRAHISLDDCIPVFMAADPSKGKRAVDWLVKTYIREGFRWEDISGGETSKAAQTLVSFAQYRTLLSDSAKNLSHYSRLGEVFAAIKPFIPEQNSAKQSGKEIKRKEKETALQQSRVLHRSDDCIVAVPLTEFASQWWGRGTEWCTASTESENYFESYNRDSPLIVITFPNGLKQLDNRKEASKGARKFQLWAVNKPDEYEVMFMDENDLKVEPEFIHDHWENFCSVVMWALKLNPRMIAYVHPDYRTESMYKDIIKTDPVFTVNFDAALKHIKSEDVEHLIDVYPRIILTLPENIIDQSHHVLALKKDITLLCEMGNDLSLESIKEVITDNKSGMQFLPDKFKTAEFYLWASETTVNILDFIPKTMISLPLVQSILQLQPKAIIRSKFLSNDYDEIIQQAFKKLKEVMPNYLMFTPENLITKAVACEAFRTSRENLNYIHPKLLDQQFWKDELLINPDIIDVFPPEYFDKKLAISCFDKDHKSVRWFPRKMITDKMYRIAAKELLLDIAVIPEKLLTPEIYLAYVKKQARNIYIVPFELRTYEMMEIALKSRTDDISVLIPDDMWDHELCLIAVQNECDALMHIKHNVPDLINEEVCIASTQYTPLSLRNVPLQFITREMCELAIGLDGNALQFVSPQLQDYELCKLAIEKSVDAMEYITQEILDKNLCILAIERDYFNLSLVPSELQDIDMIKQVIIQDFKEDNYEDSILDRLTDINAIAEHLIEEAQEFWIELKSKGNWNFDILDDFKDFVEINLQNTNVKV